jgi:hypothetical protein
MIGGKSNNAGKILKIAPLGIAFLFVVISLAFIPGSAANKTKYVKKDDPSHELKLADISVPIALLSFTLLLLIVGIVMNMKAAKEYLKKE